MGQNEPCSAAHSAAAVAAPLFGKDPSTNGTWSHRTRPASTYSSRIAGKVSSANTAQ